MKSQVFKSAWKLFRTMGVTWSMALTIAWSEAKIEKLNADRVEAQGIAFNYKAEKSIENKLRAEITRLNSVKPCFIMYKSEREEINRNSNHISQWYGKGTYNGD